MAGILEGLKVVSMELQEAIPAATLWMADWGADVIRVEPPTRAHSRGTTRAPGMKTELQLGGVEVSWILQALNRNKKGLAVDLKKEPGRDILCQLVQKADVFLSNYQVSSLKKLKLDYATL
ncbi:CoA transferase, partial [Chloroflexota bacterium]